MKRILTIVGARPQFIKAAAISHAIRDLYADKLTEDILHTGQHYDDRMSATFFKELDIPTPRYNLGVGSGAHGHQTALMLSGIEEVLQQKRYDGVLVYGDTNSTLAGALAAVKMQVPVYHVEAGLRSFRMSMPEEVNRVLTDQVSTLLFVPTEKAVKNLEREGFGKDRIVCCGDVMLDNVMHYAALLPQPEAVTPPTILATIHRDFNTDSPERLTNILSGLNEAAEALGAQVVLPLHPRTRNRIDSMATNPLGGHIRTIEPLSYLETLAALRNARLVMTDSGGLQKEAFFSRRPCAVLRAETEWSEIVDCGAAILTDDDPQRIVQAAKQLWTLHPAEPTQFGDGHAAERIVGTIAGR